VRLLLVALSLLVACNAYNDEPTPTSTTTSLPNAVVPFEEVPPLGNPPEGVEDIVGAANAYGKEHVDVFAGLFVADGRVWVGFTADASGHVAAIRERLARPEMLVAFEARYSEDELRALQARISHDIDQLARLGVGVSSIGVDVRRNRVEVGVRTVGGRGPRLLRDRYGADKIVVEEGVEVHPAG